MDDFDPTILTNLLSSANIDDVLTGLFMFLEILESENSSIIKQINFNQMYPILITILCNQKNEELLNNTTLCIVRSNRHLNTNPNMLVNVHNPTQILQSIFNQLGNTAYKNATKLHILNSLFHIILNCLNQNTIFDLSQFPLLNTIQQYYSQFDDPMQNSFYKMLNHLWSFYGQFKHLYEYRDSLFGKGNEFLNFLFLLLNKPLTSESTERISRLLFNIIFQYKTFSDDFMKSFEIICFQATKAEKTEITDIVNLLNQLVIKTEYKRCLIEGVNPVSFEELFELSDSNVYIEIILTFSMSYLPRPNIDSIEELFEPDVFFWFNEKEVKKSFIEETSKEMIKIISEIYLELPDSLKLIVLKAFAAFSFYHKPSPSNAILYKLAFDAKEKQYAFYIAIIVSNLAIEQKNLILRTDIFNSLQIHQFESETLNNSYGNYLDTKLQYEEFNLPEEILNAESLKEISIAINKKNLLFFDFMSDSNDLINICWDLLPISDKEDLETLVNFIFEQGLSILPLPPVPKDPIKLTDYNDIMEKFIRLTFKSKIFTAELYAPLLYTEILLNDEIYEEIIRIEINNNPEIKKMFHDYDQVYNHRYSMSILAHELKIEGFKQYALKFGDNWINPYIYFLKTLLDNYDDTEELFQRRTFECIEICEKNKSILPTKSSYLHKRKERMNKDDPIPNMNQFVSNLFELLNEIYLQDPSISLINRNFLDRILDQLSSPVLTIGILSPCSKLMIKYPFLFPFEDRFFFFKVLTSELSIVVNFYNQRFKKENPVNKPSHNWHMKVNRNNVFDDGIKILRRFAKYKIFLEFSFDGETGVGTGPNREFFSLMSKEFCLKKRGMWRCTNEDDEKNPFSFHEKGLFPSCVADDDLFYSLGLFVGKAINMDIIIDLPFNSAFFDLVLGREVNFEDIDLQYSKSFSNVENLYGLNFVYPVNGQIDLEMIPNGKNIEVNESNVDEYVKLFKDFTFGSKIKSKLNAFINGFNEVFDIELLNFFNGSEINRIICGDGFNLTREVLQKYVKIGSGFGPNSDQIRFLFDIILEMDYNEKILFFMFITGSSRLPIGGLAAIYPPLTVARRVLDNPSITDDDPLPTVLTCTHYFKLPAYSTKEIMKEKIMKAVMEGRENFTQT